jgi:hypothetical protein
MTAAHCVGEHRMYDHPATRLSATARHDAGVSRCRGVQGIRTLGTALERNLTVNAAK